MRYNAITNQSEVVRYSDQVLTSALYLIAITEPPMSKPDGEVWMLVNESVAEDRGWIDLSNPRNLIWHTVICSPVFISNVVSPEDQYGWGRSNQNYQRSDGLYWFSGTVGLLRFDSETGE